MESIGSWKFIENVRFGPVRKMQIWDGLSDAMITFNKKDYSEIIAYIVENDLIIASSKDIASKCDNVTILYEAKIEDYKLPKSHEDTVEVKTSVGGTYTCNLLVSCLFYYLLSVTIYKIVFGS